MERLCLLCHRFFPPALYSTISSYVPSPPLSRYLESSLVKLSYLKVPQAHVERVVGDSRGRDRCGCRVCVKARVRGLSQELVFLGEALGLGPAVPSRGHPAREHCSCLRGSIWRVDALPGWLLCPAPPWHTPGLLSPQARGLWRKGSWRKRQSCGRVTYAGGSSRWDWMGSM